MQDAYDCGLRIADCGLSIPNLRSGTAGCYAAIETFFNPQSAIQSAGGLRLQRSARLAKPINKGRERAGEQNQGDELRGRYPEDFAARVVAPILDDETRYRI